MSKSTTTDWTVLEIDGVRDLATTAARKLSQQYASTIEFEDAEQEALLILASSTETRTMLASGAGLLHRWLYQRLQDLVKVQANHRSKHISYEEAREGRE